MTPAGRPTLFERVYALLLKLYPKRFRSRFEGEMRESVRTDHVAARAKGPGAVTAFWSRTAAEAVVFGLAERRGTPDHGVRPSRWAIDWRDAYRSLRATPTVSVVAVLSLALGIGANTALFSLLNGVLLKPLPVRAPEELVSVADGSWTNPIWEQIRDRHALANAFAWSTEQFNVADRGETDLVPGVYASGGFFNVLGVRPAIGRLFAATDDTHEGGQAGPVVVISYGYWQRRYGGAADVVGRQLKADGLGYTIIGVTERGFFGPDVGRSADLMVPLGDSALRPEGHGQLDARSNWWLEIMARVAPEQTLAKAERDLRAAQPSIRLAAMPDWPAKMQADFLSTPFALEPAANGKSDLRRTYTTPLEILLVIVGGVLIIACANIANLLLARATARQRELSLRLALGASRARVGRQLMAESVMLSATGALLGLGFANWGTQLLVHQISGVQAVILDLVPDWRVLTFTAGVAIVTALIFGLAPAIGVARLTPNDALKEHGRSVIGDRRLGFRNMLVVLQVALSLALVLSGALFLRTFSSLTTASLGLDPGPVVLVQVNANRLQTQPGAARARFDDVMSAVGAVRGVEYAALSQLVPAGRGGWNTVVGQPVGTPAVPDRQRLAWLNPVSPGWFRTFGVRVLQGRDFDAHDIEGTPPVVIVNEAFVRKYLPSGPVVGAQVTASPVGRTSSSFTIVGLANDAIYRSARAGFEPTMYFPLAQFPETKVLNLAVRTSGGAPAAVVPSIARAIARAMPEASYTVRLMTDQLGGTVQRERLVAILGGFFGGLALLLAALGLYGVTSYSVNRQRGEIGIRMALGADRAGVLRLIVGRVIGLVTFGLVLGAGLSLWAAKFVAALLFHVTPRDPVTLAGAGAVLFAAALFAGWLPARRAASIDPAQVLREG